METVKKSTALKIKSTVTTLSYLKINPCRIGTYMGETCVGALHHWTLKQMQTKIKKKQ